MNEDRERMHIYMSVHIYTSVSHTTNKSHTSISLIKPQSYPMSLNVPTSKLV